MSSDLEKYILTKAKALAKQENGQIISGNYLRSAKIVWQYATKYAPIKRDRIQEIKDLVFIRRRFGKNRGSFN